MERCGTDSVWHEVAAQLLKILCVVTWGNSSREEHPMAGMMVRVFREWEKGVNNAYTDSRVGRALPLASAKATQTISLC